MKPEFWADEKLSPMEPITRLVFLGLISMADDAGRLVDSLKQIDAFIFPNSDDSARESLANLSRAGRVKLGETASGQRIIQIVNWKHQKVDHPNLSAALPPIVKEVSPPLANQSRTSRDEFATLSVPVPTISTGTSTNDLSSDSGESNGKAVSWPAEAAELWSAKVGPVEIPRCGKTLKPVVAKYGWPETRAGMIEYIELNRQKVRKLEFFAGDAVRWVEGAREPLTDPSNGELTARGHAYRKLGQAEAR
jgi:hypothetical protein